VQFDALIALVRASRATHILVEQTPGLMQSACQAAFALVTARKAMAAPLKSTSANLHTKLLPFVRLS
jgi:hypothetical protein